MRRLTVPVAIVVALPFVAGRTAAGGVDADAGAPLVLASAAPPGAARLPAPFIGNKGSRKIHCADCVWGMKISPGKRKEFRTYQEAVAEGYLPCSACRPDVAAGLPSPTRPSVAPDEIIGSTVKRVFHRGDCTWADKISAEHLMRFKTREEAIAAGKHPCPACKP